MKILNLSNINLGTISHLDEIAISEEDKKQLDHINYVIKNGIHEVTVREGKEEETSVDSIVTIVLPYREKVISDRCTDLLRREPHDHCRITDFNVVLGSGYLPLDIHLYEVLSSKGITCWTPVSIHGEETLNLIKL